LNAIDACDRRLGFVDSLHKILVFHIRLHFYALIILMVFYTLVSPGYFLIVGGLLMFTTYAYIGWREAAKSEIFFTPISFYFLWYAVCFGPSAIYTGDQILGNEKIAISAAIIKSANVAIGYLIYAWGSFSLHVGLELARPRSYLIRKNTVRTEFVQLLFICSLLYVVFQEYLGFLGMLLSTLSFGMIATLALVIFNDIRVKRIQFLAYFGVLLFTSAASASKAFMMFSFFPIIWKLLEGRNRVTRLIIFSIPMVFLYVILVQPLSMELRYQQSN